MTIGTEFRSSSCIGMFFKKRGKLTVNKSKRLINVIDKNARTKLFKYNINDRNALRKKRLSLLFITTVVQHHGSDELFTTVSVSLIIITNFSTRGKRS